MQKLPALTGAQLAQALKRAGFVEDRQKGSHLVLIHPVARVRIVIPIHASKTIKKTAFEINYKRFSTYNRKVFRLALTRL